jgi:hypothetical protein
VGRNCGQSYRESREIRLNAFLNRDSARSSCDDCRTTVFLLTHRLISLGLELLTSIATAQKRNRRRGTPSVEVTQRR